LDVLLVKGAPRSLDSTPIDIDANNLCVAPEIPYQKLNKATLPSSDVEYSAAMDIA